ncbi:hypothetical protein AB4619_22695 [Vibrio splendidus]
MNNEQLWYLTALTASEKSKGKCKNNKSKNKRTLRSSKVLISLQLASTTKIVVSN